MDNPLLPRETELRDYIRFQHDVAVALSNSTNIQESLDLLLDYAVFLDIFDSVGLYTIDEMTNDLTLTAYKGIAPEFIEKVVHISRTTDLAIIIFSGKPFYGVYPEIAQSKKAKKFLGEGIKAIAAIPIICRNKVKAALFLASHKHEEIPENSKIVLETIGAHIGTLIASLKAENILEHELRFHKMVGMISKRFVNLEPEKIDEGIELSLREIGIMINASRVAVYQTLEPNRYFLKTHEWCAEGIEPSLNKHSIDADKLSPWWKEKIDKQEKIVIHYVSTLENLEKETFNLSNTKSVVILPLKYRRELRGYVVIDSINTEMVLPNNDITSLEFLTEIFVNALENKTKEEKLKESEKKYRHIFEEIHDVYFEVKMDGTIINVSPSVKIIGMYTPNEVIGHNSREFLKCPEDAATILEILKIHGKISNFEYEFLTDNEDTILMSLNAHIAYDEEMGISKIAGILRDVTEKRISDKQLLEAKLLAENASRIKSEFLSNVSHELRTPLNLVLGFSDILLEDDTNSFNEKQRKYLEAIKTGGTRLLDQVNSLIYISEIETGSIKFEPADFFLPALISDIQRITASIAIKKRIRMEYTIDPDIKTLHADVSKFKTILHHLITNAIKFTPEDGLITVNIDSDNNHNLQVTIKDTGIGISEKDIDKIFKPFVQLDSSINRKYGGTGLGLSLVKELVEMHGGTISVKSKLGEGSEFLFSIPAVTTEKQIKKP